MIAAGLLNKFIVIQKKGVYKNAFGEETEMWGDMHDQKAYIKGFDAKNIIEINNEIVYLERLTVTIRKKITEIYDNPLLFRILYNKKRYKIISINNEGDNSVMLVERINE